MGSYLCSGGEGGIRTPVDVESKGFIGVLLPAQTVEAFECHQAGTKQVQ